MSDRLPELHGLYTWQLTDYEREDLARAVGDGRAEIDYDTAAGVYLGMGRVKVLSK